MALLLLLMLPCHPGGFQCSSLYGRPLHPGAFLTKPVSLREAFYKLKTTTLLLRDFDPMDGLDKSYLTITGSKKTLDIHWMPTFTWDMAPLYYAIRHTLNSK